MSELQVRDAGYLLRSPRPSMLIESILARGGVHILAAPAYSGKTFYALEAMRAIAEGEPFLGHFKVPQAGNVLYLGNDSPAWDIASQFDKVIGLPEPTAMGEDIARSSLGSYGFIFDDSFALNDAANAEQLVRAAHAFDTQRESAHFVGGERFIGTSLIVIDTLRSMHGFEEKDNTEMQHVVNLLRYVARNTSAAVLALHHFNKSSPGERDRVTLERLRGASALAAGVDSVLALIPHKNGTIGVMNLKHRVCPTLKDFVYKIEETTWFDGSEKYELRLVSDVGLVNPTVLTIVRNLLNGNALMGNRTKTSDLEAAVAKLPGMNVGRRAENAVGKVLRELDTAGEIHRVPGLSWPKEKGEPCSSDSK